MKFKEVTYGESIHVGIVGHPEKWDRILIKMDLEENDLPETAMDIAKNTIANWHKKRYPELYVDVIDEPKKYAVIIDEIPYGSSIVDDIKSCTELPVLESYKFVAKSKPEYQEAYNRKLTELKYPSTVIDYSNQ